MSAVKLIFKRSSILGKRPTGENLEPGEIGLNTNPTEPALYFEVNDGSVVKVGPTAYLPQQPTPTPSRGELWVDGDINTLSVGTDLNQWKKVAAPFLGGTNGLTVFVGPDYEFATDSLANDGQTIPFVTINRAVIEVTKKILEDRINGLSTGNNRYLIVLAPGRHCVVNSPGVSPSNFTYNLSSSTTEITQAILSSFNPESTGSLIVPRGVSIIGMDLKKCEIHPTYVPTYTHPSFPDASTYRQQTVGDGNGIEGPIYSNQPLSSIFKWSGNTYLSNFTCLDKIETRTVVQIQKQETTQYALFTTVGASGLNLNDFVQINYLSSTSQAGSSFAGGQYYVSPVDSYTFLASPVPWPPVSDVAQPILFSDFSTPLTKGGTGKLVVNNIYPYFIPFGLESYELSNYSHHRLSVIKNSTKEQLQDYYTKIQIAFPNIFGGQVDLAVVSPPEYDIVAPANEPYPNNLISNSTDNSSPYENMVNHRSDYGMAHGDYDGNLVTGFKSVIVNSSTAVILQKDPVAYELYQTTSQNWSTLCKIIQEQPSYSNRSVTQIPTSPQLEALNAAKIPDIRYYYQTLTYSPDNGATSYSIGIPDPDNDFRHFGFRSTGSNSYLQSQSTYTIGAAIGVWAKEGSIISLTNATTNFGSVAFQSEGFAGIGTLGGANDVSKNFLQTGLVCPLALTNLQVESDNQKQILSLGSTIQFVGIDPLDPSIQLIYLQSPFDPASILPFSLRPGSAIFTTDGFCTYRAFFVTDGSPTCILSGNSSQNPYSPGGAVLRVRYSDSTLPNSDSVNPKLSYTYLDIPYIRRFVDPRTKPEKSYGLNVFNSASFSQAPQLGSVLRLNQTGQNLSSSLKRNFQFDPGQYGGYAQVFTVDTAETSVFTRSVNFNNKISDSSQSENYTVYLTLTDSGAGWLQSLYVPPFGLVPLNLATGNYQTYLNKNYFVAENNLWGDLYYNTVFSVNNGPTKVAPDNSNSPYVISSVLERSEPVESTWQGSIAPISGTPSILDPVYQYYVLGIDIDGNPVPAEYQVPDSYKLQNPLSYFRGSTVPYVEFAGEFTVDLDDGTSSLGIIFTRDPVPPLSTISIANSVIDQTYQPMSTPWASAPTFGRPSVMSLDVLSVKNITNPKESLSILQLSKPGVNSVEYVRVIGITGNRITVIRNYYSVFYNSLEGLPPNNTGWVYIGQPGTTVPAGTPVPPVTWPNGTVVTPCVSTEFPEPIVYDPSWSNTKSAIFRYYQLLGFPINLMRNFLIPKSPGNRIFLNTQIPAVPQGGYANTTTSYPVEFNTPSTIISNTHTWQYCGYLDYSKGLPKYQVNEISRKLSYDFLSTATFGGRLTVSGANDNGNIVLLGPLREALTGNYYENETPLANPSNRLQYNSPIDVEQPAAILVFSVDDISGGFNGTQRTFELRRGTYFVPSEQLESSGIFVFLGGVVQLPNDAYTIFDTDGINAPYIRFSEAPPVGTSCDIRIVTSEDQSQTLEVVEFNLSPAFDGIETSFTLSPPEATLNNLNSFVFLGGVEQLPQGPYLTNAAYTISTSSGVPTLTFIGGAPLPGTTIDVRGILSGTKYRPAASSVFVNSVDDISPSFNSTTSTFPLFVLGQPLDPAVVTSENMFVSLGGTMQLPLASVGDPLAGIAYTVGYNTVTNEFEITFAAPPPNGATCNIRVITGTGNEFITCPLPLGIGDTPLVSGPGVTVNDIGQIIDIDAGLIN